MNPESPSGRASFWPMAIVLLVLILVAAMAMTVVFVKPGPKRQVVTLSDGTRIEYLGAAYGNTRFSTDKGWMRLARRVLPPRFRRWVPPEHGTVDVVGGVGNVASNALTVYLYVKPQISAPPPRVSHNRIPYLEDSTGERFRGSMAIPLPIGILPDARTYAVTFSNYPRRQAELVFKLADEETNLLATFRVVNPGPTGPFPIWQAPPFPQTLTNGPVELTIEGLILRLAGGGQTWLEQDWKIKSTNAGWSQAEVHWATFSDATGNVGSPSTNESAWKAHIDVERLHFEDYEDWEKLTVSDLPMHAGATSIALNQSKTISGVSVRLVNIFDAGALMFSNGIPFPTGPTNITDELRAFSRPFLLAEVTNALPDDRILFRFTDDRGRLVKDTFRPPANDWHARSDGVRVYSIQFIPAADAKSLNIEAVLDRPMLIDSYVDPKNLRPEPR